LPSPPQKKGDRDKKKKKREKREGAARPFDLPIWKKKRKATAGILPSVKGKKRPGTEKKAFPRQGDGERKPDAPQLVAGIRPGKGGGKKPMEKKRERVRGRSHRGCPSASRQ